jgi:hypothetical protein
MTKNPTWEVDLYVDGPVTVRRPISTQKQGFCLDDFYSDIEIVGIPSGFKATITARAPDERLAFEAAVFFFGRMLDVLAFLVDRSLYLSLTERVRSREGPLQQDVRRVLLPGEFEIAFKEVSWVQMLSPSRPSPSLSPSGRPVGEMTTASFLRSLGWYRKGLYTNDPFDKVLAFWNAIEIVASRYYRNVPSIALERARKGIKNQVWACFIALWGACDCIGSA